MRLIASLVWTACLLLQVAPVRAGETVPPARTALLVAGPAETTGTYALGVSFELPEGWHTYWRNPGDAGVAPLVSTDGSRNLKSLAVRYPAPERYFDGFSTSIVYHDKVVLPVTVTAEDPSAPVDLRLSMTFGYCKEICVPATADLDAELVPGSQTDGAAAEAIATYEARVPVDESRLGSSEVELEPLAVDGDALLLTVRAAEAVADVDLFVEPPDGWYLAQPTEISREDGKAVFRLPLKGKPKKAPLPGAEFRVTVVGVPQPFEAVRTAP